VTESEGAEEVEDPVVDGPDEPGPDTETDPAQGDGAVVPDGPKLDELLRHIKEERGFDFTGYKRASLARRVERRMQAVEIGAVAEYVDFLIVHPEEYNRLFDTILINVTSFFRDPSAWDYLREEFVPALAIASEARPIRVWCAGCASGEEAYSLAIVLAEHIGVDQVRERVKVYATDVDEDALAYARSATYTEREVQGVPEELREKYFEPVGNRFLVRKELRRSVIFGRNDLVQDAPISHVDVLTCRNTLMYFNAETQAQVLNRLHFALRPDGVLFLGKAEMLLSHTAHFRAVEIKRRFFRKIPAGPRDRRLMAPTLPVIPPGDGPTDDDVAQLLQSALMSSGAAQVVLDADNRLAFVNSRAMHLFGLTGRDMGRPVQDLEMSYRPVELRAHIEETVSSRQSRWLRDVDLVRGVAEPTSLDIQLVPLTHSSGTPIGLTIVFNDVTAHRRLQHELEYANRQLETAYEELQSTVEELETTNEELQSTVEELETTNEELQSTNEELETMNEELQSMNDELHFSNEALREGQDEVARLNRFMVSVLSSMHSGVVVVDPDLHILAWNARSEDLWGIRGDEAVGQHLMNLDIGLPVERLHGPLRSRLTDGGSPPETVEVEAVNRRGRPVAVRVTVTDILDEYGGQVTAAMLLMDATERS